MTMNKTIIAPGPADSSKQSKWALLKPETRFFLSKTITYPAFQECLDSIRITHSMSGEEPAGMLLLGDTGVGKTTILRKYVKAFESSYGEKETETLTKWPIIHIRIPSKPTIKGVIKKMLKSVEHVAYDLSGTQDNLSDTLDTLIEEQHVELIIFDEFQHLLKEQALKSTRDVANFIKNLMEDHELAIVMAGIPEGETAISQHDELYERFTFEQVHLHPFTISDKDSFKEFYLYIKTCAKILNDTGVKTINLTSDLMIKRIYLATGGKARMITRLFVKALESTDLSYRLTISDFLQSYENRPLNPKLKTFNPFEADKSKIEEKLKAYK